LDKTPTLFSVPGDDFVVILFGLSWFYNSALAPKLNELVLESLHADSSIAESTVYDVCCRLTQPLQPRTAEKLRKDLLKFDFTYRTYSSRDVAQ
jgi:hypothetical protein